MSSLQLHQRPEKKIILLEKAESVCKQLPKKYEKWQKQLAAWTVTQGSSVALGHPTLAHRPSIAHRLSCEAEDSEGLSSALLCLGKVWQWPFLLPAGPVWTVTVSNWGKGSFFAHMDSFYHKESKLHMEFFDAHQPLWSNQCWHEQMCLTVEEILSY